MSLRVLHVQDHTLPELSGYAIRSRYLVRTEQELGVESEVVSSARHPCSGQRDEEIDGIRFHRTPWPRSPLDRPQLRVPFWRETVLTRALRRRVLEVGRAFRPDLLHAHSPIFDGLAALGAARRLGVPVVYHVRAFWEDDAVDKRKFSEGSFVYRQVRRLETAVCRKSDLVVTICEGLRADLVGRGLPPEKVLVVGNGVDAARFSVLPRDGALARRLDLDGAVVVGFVGSFFHYEGLPLLVEALARIAPKHPRLRLLLVGGGESEEETRTRAASLGIADRVRFAGRVPHAEVEAYYSLIDLLVYPRISRRITELVTPLKPLEALAMGKEVLGSDVGGIRELLDGCPSGRLFSAGSATALAAALDSWIAEGEAGRAPRQAAGRAWVANQRAWPALVAPLVQAYGALSAARAARAQ